MIRSPTAPLEGYGGARDNVRISDMEDAKRFIRERGVELPWQLRDWRVSASVEIEADNPGSSGGRPNAVVPPIPDVEGL